jgi:hypothetical protein
MSESRRVGRGGREEAGERGLASGLGRVVVVVIGVAGLLSTGFIRASNLASVLHLILSDVNYLGITH